MSVVNVFRMQFPVRWGVALVGAFATCLAFGGTTRYVSQTGSDDNSGLTSGSAFRTVGKAVSVSGEGDTIIVAASPMEYPLDEEIILTAGITIRGASGNPADVIVRRLIGSTSGNYYYRPVKLDHAEAVVKDITICGGINHNAGTHGGGVYITANGGRLEHCIVTDCMADWYNSAGGVYIAKNSPGVVDRCVISNCSGKAWSGYGGAAVMIEGGTVRNTLMVGNHISSGQTGAQGGTVYIKGGVVENCTIAGNDSAMCAGVVADGGTVRNCVIGASTSTGTTDPTAVIFSGKAACVTNCVADAAINDWCDIETDIFESPFVGDWRAKVGSAAYDAATDEEWMADSLDLDGNVRRQGVAADIGAYERDAVAFSASVVSDTAKGLDPLTVTFTVKTLNAAGTVTCKWDWDGNGSVDETTEGTTASHQFGAGDHRVKVTVVSGGTEYVVPGYTAIKVGARTIPVAVGGSIADAIAQAVDGTEIVLATGTHQITEQISVEKGVTIRGETGNPEDVILHSDRKSHRVFYVNSPDAKIADLAIENSYLKAYGDMGAAIKFSILGGMVSNCVIRSCQMDDWNHGGAGIGIPTGCDNALVTHCVISNCYVTGGCNTAFYGGGAAVAMLSGTVRNCLFVKNVRETSTGSDCPYGTVRIQGGLLENCTIADNTAGSCAGVFAHGGTVRNCIIAGNRTVSDTAANLPVWAGSASYFVNCVADLEINDDCDIVAEPFADFAAGDYSPAPGTASVNGALPFDWMTGATDLAGNDRIRGAAPDVGCYEADPNAFAATFAMSAEEGFAPVTVTNTVTAVNAGANGVTCDWDWGDGWTDRTSDMTVTHAFEDFGTFEVRLTVTDNETGKTFAPPVKTFKALPRTLYVVKDNATAEAPYATRETAAPDIATALEAASDGCEIAVEEGTYPITSVIVVNKGVEIRGATGNPEDVILQSDSKPNAKKDHRVFDLNHAQAKISSLVVENAYENTHGAYDSAALGAGVRINKLGGTVSNCVVRGCVKDNWHFGGGGIGIVKEATNGLVTHCVISNCEAAGSCNSAYYGGGGAIVIHAGTVRNCLFTGNVRATAAAAADNSCFYGTVRITGGTLENCTVAGNSAGSCAGVWAQGGTVKDCVIFGNRTTVDTAANLPVWAGTAACFVNCASEFEINENCNATDDPFTAILTGDYTLAAGSTLIDAGTAEDWMDGATDLAGNDRIRGEKPDLGCYEADPYAFAATFSASAAAGFAPVTVTYTVTAVNAGLAGITCYWDWNNDGIVDAETDGSTTHDFDAYGDFEVSLAVKDNASGVTVKVSGTKPFASRPKTMYVVKDNAGAASPYATEETGAANLGDALEAALDGAEIIVSEGVYPVTAEYFIEKGVTVRGKTGNPEDVELRGDGQNHRIFRLRHPQVKVCDLVISNGKRTNQDGEACGAGIRIENLGGTVSNCVIRGCTISNWNRGGGGVFITADSPDALVTHCVISNCLENSGTSCNVDWIGGGAAVAMKNGTVRNCLITGNVRTGTTGNTTCLYGSVRVDGGLVESCTVADNAAAECAGVWARGGTVRNCLIAGNRTTVATAANLPVWAGDASCFEHCVADKEINASCAVETSPFRNFAAGDYYPALVESVVDAADHQDWMDGAMDLAGDARVQGDEADIGCFELKPVFSAGFTANATKGVKPFNVQFTAAVANAGGSGSDLYWTWGDEGDVEHEGGLTEGHTYAEYGTYTARLRVYSREKGESVEAPPVTITVLPEVIWVRPGGEGAVLPFGTRETAATNIQEAIEITMPGCEVRLVAGTYPVTEQIELGAGVRVVGETGRPEDVVITRMDTGAHRLAFLRANDAVLASVTLENGYLNSNSSIYYGYGAGLFISASGGTASNVVVRGCFSNNWALNGGGVYIEAPGSSDVVQLLTHSVVTNCGVVSYNGALRGPNGGHGVYAKGGSVRNSLIVGNTSYDDYTTSATSGCIGGAVYLAGNARLENCTVTGNRSYFASGVVIEGTTALALNCVIAGNVTAAEGYPNDAVYAGDMTRIERCVTDSAAPLNVLCRCEPKEKTFRSVAKGDYRLLQTSAAVNLGAKQLWMTSGSTDLAGLPRCVITPDAGCYESQVGNATMLILR